MIRLSAAAAEAIEAACRLAWPEEGCGLLLGRAAGADLLVRRAEPSRNLADAPARRFEVDPALRFRLERAARCGADPVVGHFHSHPEGPAEPSAVDLAAAHEPGLVWLIAAVREGRLAELRAWRPRLDDAGRAIGFVAETIERSNTGETDQP